MLQYPSIIKRDGETEPFDESKIARVVRATGIADPQAGKIAQNVASKLHALGRKRVHSHVLRDIVLDELQSVNHYAAGLYEWYEDTK